MRATPRQRDPESGCRSTPVVVSILQAWRQIAPYTGQDDFVFASTALKGKKPVSGDSVRRDHLRPAAIRAGLPPLGRHANIS